MSQRLYTIETLGGRNSKTRKTILKRMNELNGFDLGTSINKYKKAYGVTSADEMYELLRQEYNDDIENQRKKKIKIKKELKNKQKPASKIATFFRSYKRAVNVEKSVKYGKDNFVKQFVDVYSINCKKLTTLENGETINAGITINKSNN